MRRISCWSIGSLCFLFWQGKLNDMGIRLRTLMICVRCLHKYIIVIWLWIILIHLTSQVTVTPFSPHLTDDVPYYLCYVIIDISYSLHLTYDVPYYSCYFIFDTPILFTKLMMSPIFSLLLKFLVIFFVFTYFASSYNISP